MALTFEKLNIECSIPLRAIAKGRPRHTLSGRVYTPKETKDFERAVLISFLAKTANLKKVKEIIKDKHTTVSVSISAEFKDPNPNRWGTPKSTKPDIDNIAKAVLDALDRHAWCDEKISQLNLGKVYAEKDSIVIKIQYTYKKEKV